MKKLTQDDMILLYICDIIRRFPIWPFPITDCGSCWLVDKKMSKADLRKAAGLAPNTMTKLRRDEPVAMGVLEKICGTLDTDFGDIVEYIKNSEV